LAGGIVTDKTKNDDEDSEAYGSASGEEANTNERYSHGLAGFPFFMRQLDCRDCLRIDARRLARSVLVGPKTPCLVEIPRAHSANSDAVDVVLNSTREAVLETHPRKRRQYVNPIGGRQFFDTPRPTQTRLEHQESVSD
jgi:hypothetical protein